MTAGEVHDFFKGYAAAFSAGDIDEVCWLWAYPAFMTARGKLAALDLEQFRRNTEALCAFYAAQNMSRADKEVLEISRLTETVASVRTADTLSDASGATIASWEHVYLLSETGDGLRVVAAMPDAELAVWSARGTPLGSW